jgi:hypothetical protein
LPQSTKGVHGKQDGISTTNEGRLAMWNNWEMKYASFIHNDDVKCFPMNVQGTYKLVVMGHINYKDHVLIKRQ